MNVSAALESAAEILHNGGVAEYRREAASLLAFVLERDDVFLIAHPEYELSDTEVEKYRSVITRRSEREPFQYIVGHQEFYGLDFKVNPDVLIPRPETEILVEAAIEIAGKIDNPTFCEMGAGSGCISISILYNVPGATAVAVDISPDALAIARQNAQTHRVLDRLDLRIGDVFADISGTFDLIVSNPPYVPHIQLELLQAEVKQFEPHTALFGGVSGLDIIKRIISGAHHFLRPSGVLLMEVGFDQSERVAAMLEAKLWDDVEFLSDLQGIPRILKARAR